MKKDSGVLEFSVYELYFSKGLIAKILGKSPIPPRNLGVKKSIAWGDGFIYGGREAYQSGEIRKQWVRSGLSGRRTKKTNSSSS